MLRTTWTKRAVALFAATVIVVAVILLWPEHVDGWFANWVWNLPLDGSIRLGIYQFSQGAANVLLFVPVGLFASWWLPRWWMAIMLGIVMSAGFETAQLLLPGRTGDVWDVVWNGLGSTIGAALGIWVEKLRRTNQERKKTLHS